MLGVESRENREEAMGGGGLTRRWKDTGGRRQ
jgi:hypothetical protein